MDIREYWWFDLILGLVTLALGLYCFSRPDLAILTLGRVFGVFLLIFGGFHAFSSLRERSTDRGWYFSFAEGILYVLLSFFLLLTPASVIILNRIMGIWFIGIGVFRFLSSRLHGLASAYTFSGDVISLLFGLFLLVYPKIFAGFITIVLGIILIIIALIMIANAISMWKNQKRYY